MDSKTEILGRISLMSEEEKLVKVFALERVLEHLDVHIELSKDESYRRRREGYRLIIAKTKIQEFMDEALPMLDS